MAQIEFGFKVEGADEVGRALARIPRLVRDKAFDKVIKPSLKRIKNRILINLSGAVIDEDTGAYVSAMESASVRTVQKNEDQSVFAISMPTRAKSTGEPGSPSRISPSV